MMGVPEHLLAMVDEAAGRQHSRDGAVAAALARVLARARAELAAEIDAIADVCERRASEHSAELSYCANEHNRAVVGAYRRAAGMVRGE